MTRKEMKPADHMNLRNACSKRLAKCVNPTDGDILSPTGRQIPRQRAATTMKGLIYF